MAVMKTVYMSALRRAAQSLGSVEALRAHLQVPMSQLAGWLHGEAPPPEAVFLKVVDLLAEEELTAIKRGLRDQNSAA
jgi:hypothetical protein